MAAHKYKTSGWHVDSEGTASTPVVKFHEDYYAAARQYHLFAASAATSDYPTDVALFETVDGRQIERVCYKHTDDTEETSVVSEE